MITAFKDYQFQIHCHPVKVSPKSENLLIIHYIYFVFYQSVWNISLSKVFKCKIITDHVIIACRNMMIIIIRKVRICDFFKKFSYEDRKNGSLTVQLEFIYCNNFAYINGI